MNGTDLLADYRGHRSEAAFGELVCRYTNLVYSVAKRRLSNVTLAQEVTQIVFIRLAKSVPNLRGDAELVAWLHRTTVHVSVDLWRSETRRRIREEKAASMQPAAADNPHWDDLSLILDDALNDLNNADRQAILLRFFDGKAMREMGDVLGISEDAAKMRVSRALERLRGQLGNRGVTCGAVALGTLLAERAIEAAPGPLVTSLVHLRIPAATGGLVAFFAQVPRLKLISGLEAIVVVATISIMLLRSRLDGNRTSPTGASQASSLASASAANAQTGSVAGENSAGAVDASEPDPLKLLQAVAQARQRIGSGSIHLQLAVERRVRGRTETNHIALAALFDGEKLRWEQVGREYRYTAVGDGSTAQEARMLAEGLDRAAGVREGLLQGFEAYYVTAYDGAALLSYRETDGQPSGAVIDNPTKGSSQSIFDPRCLGLGADLFVSSTIENSLGYKDAKSVKLVGKESVNGVPAWHVHVESRSDLPVDLWMDVAHPVHVVKSASGSKSAVSRYDSAATKDLIPVEVTTTGTYGTMSLTRRYLETDAQFNIPVDPVSWTLAGLGMQIGTDVADVRIHRRIGYWTGAGLSENLPNKKKKLPAPRAMAELLAAMEMDPASPAALEAALWIMLNTPDGPEVDKAGEVILREHTRDTNLVQFCQELERLRHLCSTNLLYAILNENPSAQVRVSACFSLATLRKEEAKFGQNQKAATEAMTLFERVIAESRPSGPAGKDLASKAKAELYELRHLALGHSAPETEGQDFDGQRIRLSDYRGRVVVVWFWCCGYSEAVEHKKLSERMNGKPVALIGVSGDNQLEAAKVALETQQLSWPQIWENGVGPIHKAWNVHKWLTTFVLDVNGVIRYRDVRGKDLDAAVDVLMRE